MVRYRPLGTGSSISRATSPSSKRLSKRPEALTSDEHQQPPTPSRGPRGLNALEGSHFTGRVRQKTYLESLRKALPPR